MIFVVAGVILLVLIVSRRGETPRTDGLLNDSGRSVDWSVTRPLLRVEARRLLRHPATLTGILLTPLMFWAAIGSRSVWWQADTDLSLALVPLGWASILAGGYMALWPRRHGSAELFATLPVGETTRTASLAGAVIAPGLAAAILLVGANIWLGSRDMIGAPSPAEQTAGVVIVMGGAALGIAVARLWPRLSIAGPLLAVVAVTFAELGFAELGGRLRYLAFLSPPFNSGHPGLEWRFAGWHVLYLAGLVTVAGLVAVAKNSRARPAVTAITAVSLVVGLSGWIQARPVSASAAGDRASILKDPAAHQRCETSSEVTYCAYHPYKTRIPEWERVVSSVLSATPRSDKPRVIQRPEISADSDDCVLTPYLALVDPDVRAQVKPVDIWTADNDVHPGLEWPERLPCGGHRLEGLALALQAASWAVGLPPSAAAGRPLCQADGQSRTVAALWLAGQAIPGGAQVIRTLVEYEATDPGASPEHLDVETWNALSLWAVRWHLADIDAALDLLELPGDQVRGALAADWGRFTAASTPSADLLRAAGIEPTTDAASTPLTGDGACP